MFLDHPNLKIELKMKCLNKLKQNALLEKLFSSIRMILKATPKNANRKYLKEVVICTPHIDRSQISK